MQDWSPFALGPLTSRIDVGTPPTGLGNDLPRNPVNSNIPHYLLTATVNKHDPRGQWRFALQAADGSADFSADDAEPQFSGERLELLAVVRGLEALEQPSRVTLVNPPRSVRRGLEHGLAQWREAGWMWDAFGRRVPVKDCDLWQRLDRALRIHQVDHRQWRLDRPLAPAREATDNGEFGDPPAGFDSPRASRPHFPRRQTPPAAVETAPTTLGAHGSDWAADEPGNEPSRVTADETPAHWVAAQSQPAPGNAPEFSNSLTDAPLAPQTRQRSASPGRLWPMRWRRWLVASERWLERRTLAAIGRLAGELAWSGSRRGRLRRKPTTRIAGYGFAPWAKAARAS